MPVSVAAEARNLVRRTLDWFAPEGALQRALQNYRLRDEQLQMAESVAAALENRSTLVVEAGTGTGKSMAYLVPAMLSGGKVIISTGTKNLQDQLFNKDIPDLLAIGKYAINVSLLKGRANYLCFHRLKQAQEDPRLLKQRSSDGVSPWLALRSLQEWGLSSEDGDLTSAEAPKLQGIPLSRVTSTSENCLGTDCPDYSECFVLKARRRAQEADMVVVNHHLLLADLVLREEGFTELLPDADAVILDEAHQLPQVGSQFFGHRYSYHQLSELARDVRAELREVAGDMPDLKVTLGDYEEACALLLQKMRGGNQRMAWQDTTTSLEETVLGFCTAVGQLKAALEPARVRSKGLEQAAKRCAELERFFTLLQSDEAEYIRWIDRTDRGFVLHLTPLDVAEQFRKVMTDTPSAWVLTSATLSVDNGFEHFLAQMGAESAETQMLDSPFDYARNAKLYLPDISVEPNHPDYQRELATKLLPVIESAAGGAFVLCTSLQAVNYYAQYLRDRLNLKVLAQGDAGKHALIERFKEAGNAVLVATSSFWEGVDVQGDALRLVVIDKLPFAHPGDPVMKARLDAIKKQGGSPFFDYQVPQAVIALKQGVGRLIRDHEDRGVVMICDPRVTRKHYGRVFLSSLPPMPQTRQLDDIAAFYENPDISP